MKNFKEKFKLKLAENNYKFTRQREIIVETILENENWHFNAEDLFAAVKEKDSEIGMATIYRTLELLEKLDLIHILDFNDDSRVYELYLKDHHHHHLICKGCGKLVEFSDQGIDYFEKELEDKYDFSIDEHKLRFYGYCGDCRDK
ncbi:Fur family transcriptional regulator [Halanaerobium hydrogeniformans]|uniref:Ferric uptake regulator, Fur family n=1 Tax=Halanaerobium hydrogeniformans TaxID=656519 RepID=E4RLG4_HALHG|nr:Fur family transcriptional regulator [Halanaerobium hydrogeniformans]ADQ14878.1 ferric uptake regulator, Fur family [Halanaerobium hydrogeniformans]